VGRRPHGRRHHRAGPADDPALFNGLSEVELLARVAGEQVTDAYAQVFATIGKLTSGDAKKAFEEIPPRRPARRVRLQGGRSRFRPPRSGSAFAKNPERRRSRRQPRGGVRHDHKMDDGRFANNGWLQECPDR